jgi:hypothetical protein
MHAMKSELIAVVKELRKLQVQQDSFVESLPSSVSSCFWDNDYTNAQSMQRDLLINALFQEDAEEIFWFLFEFKPKPTPQLWLADGTAIAFTCDEDYYKYLETV